MLYLSFLLTVALGHIVGTLIFYFTHRFIFHGSLGRLPILKQIRKMHTMHHARPQDLEKAFFPHWAKALIALTVVCVGMISVPFTFGICTFFPVYTYRHWKAHNGSSARWAKHHMHHHLVDPRTNFGGIYPIVDAIFRTSFSSKR